MPELYEWQCTNCGRIHKFADKKAPKECLDCHGRCELADENETAEKHAWADDHAFW